MESRLRSGINELLANAASIGFAAALLGSARGNEVDGAVIGCYADADSAVSQLRSFLEYVESWHKEWGFAVSTSMMDQASRWQNEPVAHILYYPSISELEYWELPSFAAYVHDRGQFVGPLPEGLRKVYRRYRERRWEKASLLVQELAYYQEILVHELIHASAPPTWWNAGIGLHRLRYAARFAAIELKVDGLTAEEAIPFWDWREIHPTTFDDIVIGEEVRRVLFTEDECGTLNGFSLQDALVGLFRGITEQITLLVQSRT